jgi:hypothetical protein
VRRGLGPLGAWPALPSDAQAPEAGRALTLLTPDFTTPQTARAGFGVTRALGARTSVSGALRYRRTANLPRRVDLNLRPSAVWHDPNGRPVYGDLQQAGRIIVADAGTNRRFGDYDAVSGISTDGWSEYRGATLSLDHRPTAGLRLFGSYTYSQTRDNWLSPWGGEAGTDLPPFPGEEGPADWAEGVSDFDLPHRLVTGAEVEIPAPLELKLAGLYRYRSGYPFTPGLAAGVDANGDGSSGNDPAFIDSALLESSGLLREWDCLGDQVGGFAARNSCRAPGVASLDLRLTAGLRRQGGLGLELTLDALNLLSSGDEYPDRALFLVDPEGALATDAASGTVTLPLLPNPNFGKPLARLTEGRIFRLGLRLTY